MTTAVMSKHRIKKNGRLWVKPRELDVEDFLIAQEAEPLSISEDKLEIDSNRLEIGRVYTFDFLDEKMVLWKSEDNTIDVYQIVEE